MTYESREQRVSPQYSHIPQISSAHTLSLRQNMTVWIISNHVTTKMFEVTNTQSSCRKGFLQLPATVLLIGFMTSICFT